MPSAPTKGSPRCWTSAAIRWGRTEETYGEDPHLVARFGIAFVRGLQGEDGDGAVVATVKHFVGYLTATIPDELGIDPATHGIPTLLDALRARFGERVEHLRGCEVSGTDRSGIAAVVIGGAVRVETRLTNTDHVTDDEIVQLYILDPEASVTRPVLELEAFHRATLTSGSAVRIEQILD